MPDSADKYQGHHYRIAARRQSVIVIAVTVAIVALWNLLFILAPLFQSESLYRFFSFICHQIPERSLSILGGQMAVCSRCFGIYFGLLAGIALYPLWRGSDNVDPISKLWLFLSLIPVGIDWTLTFLGIWENTHLSRFLTGAFLGIVCASFIVPAVIEIARNFSPRSNNPR